MIRTRTALLPLVLLALSFPVRPVVYVAAGRVLYALDGATGVTRWTITANFDIDTAVAVDGGLVPISSPG